MARNFDGTDDQLTVAVAVATAAPLSLAGWCNADNLTVSEVLVNISKDTDDNDDFYILLAGAVAGDFVHFNARDAGVGGAAITTTAFSAGVWQHVLGVELSSSSRAVYLNGGGKGTNTTLVEPTGLNRTSIGVRNRLSDTFFFDGLLAECCVFNDDLSDAEAVMLANGLHPFALRLGSLVGYWPIYGHASPEVDWSGNGNNMTVTGTTVADHIYTTPPLRQAAGWRGAFVAAAANPAYQPWYHRAPVLAQ